MTGSVVCARRIHGGKYMPKDWVPTQHDVIIGRGKKVYHHAGNQKLRDLVKVEVEAYAQAKNRAAKSVIIIRIFDAMRADTEIGFVKKEPSTKKYYAVEDTAAKITIAQYFRDALADGYKSSKQYKQKLRDAMKRSVSDVGMSQNSEEAVSAALKRSASAGDSIHAAAPTSGSMFDNENCFQDSPSHFMRKMALNKSSTASARASMNMLQRVSAILEEPRDNCPFPDIKVQGDGLLFANLYQAFGSNVNKTSDPFEPTPIKESSCSFPTILNKHGLDDTPMTAV